MKRLLTAIDDDDTPAINRLLAADTGVAMPLPLLLRTPPPELSEQIASRIAACARDLASPYHDAAARHGALLLYRGWGTDFALRPDGTVIRIDEIPIADPSEDHWYKEINWAIMAVAFAARRYPELRQILPRRPADAVDCAACEGRGMMPLNDMHFLCVCEGLGWVMDGRRSPPSD